MVEVLDWHGASEWLSSQKLDTRVAFAARCALRAFPSIALAPPQEFEAVALPTLRSLLTAVVTVWVTRDDQQFRFKGSQSIPFSSVDAAQMALFDARTKIGNRPALSASLSAHCALTSGYSDSSVIDARNAHDRSVLNTPHAHLAAQDDMEALETLHSAVGVFERPIWTDGPSLVESDKLIRHLTNLGKDWLFCKEWYLAMQSGQPASWSFQHSVLLIHDEVWAGGARLVAEEILRIEDRLNRTPLALEVARRRVGVLFASAHATEVTASSLADQIEQTITDCMNEMKANCLPEEFSTLERLPPILRRIAATVTRSEDEKSRAELEAEIQLLAAEIATLKAQLIEARARTVTGVLSKSLLEQTGKSLGDWKMWGALSGSMFVFFGDVAVAQGVEDIVGSVRELFWQGS